MKRLLLLILPLCGCEYLGLANNTNSVARFEYKNGDCELGLWQSAINAAEDEIVKYKFNEKIAVTNECALQLEYSEIETVEDE